MGTFSEIDIDMSETRQPDNIASKVVPFSLDSVSDVEPPQDDDEFDDDAEQQAEADSAPAALEKLNQDAEADKKASDDEKRREHEEKEAQRKAEWDAKHAAKKEAREKALRELDAMSDDDVVSASVKRVGKDNERLTRRNMKDCVTEHIQTLCLDDTEFARLTMNPLKNMINCFHYINRHAFEFIRKEMDDNDEKSMGYGMGSDVPDDLCYRWAEDYFRDPHAKEDEDKEEKFVPKQYYGVSSKSKKKEAPKKKPPAEKNPAKAPEADLGQLQMELGGVAV